MRFGKPKRFCQEQADELLSAQRADRFAEQRIQEAGDDGVSVGVFPDGCMLARHGLFMHSCRPSQQLQQLELRSKWLLLDHMAHVHEALSDQQRLLNSRARRKRTQTMDFRQSAPCQNGFEGLLRGCSEFRIVLL